MKQYDSWDNKIESVINVATGLQVKLDDDTMKNIWYASMEISDQYLKDQ
jgi:hypothetical protein